MIAGKAKEKRLQKMYIFDMDGTLADDSIFPENSIWYNSPENFRNLPFFQNKPINTLVENGNRNHGGIVVATAINENLMVNTIREIMEAKQEWLYRYLVGINIVRVDWYLTSDGTTNKSDSYSNSKNILIDNNWENCKLFCGDSCLVKNGEIVKMCMRDERKVA